LGKSSVGSNPWKVVVFTSCALAAFAGNSVLCRLALGGGAIDAASFTGIRLLSGTLVLALVLTCSPRKSRTATRSSWASAAALFAYAAAFSFAYLTLSAATGALILFGAVQLTMLTAAHFRGEPLRRNELTGAGLAFAGLLYLVFPGITAPSLTGSLLMAGAGIAWGIYSLRGRGSLDPLTETTSNFAMTLPCVLLLSLCFFKDSHVSWQGGLLALLSGGLASGLGYVLWYAALPGMSSARASIVQLAVPLLAALGGVVFLAETLSARLVLAATAILGGIALAMSRRESKRNTVDKDARSLL
jgi:drug/metabolite transporter (DMT)-like permease